MTAPFKVGDRVRLTAAGESHWPGQSGGGAGTVTVPLDEDGWTEVRWDIGHRFECYRGERDLTPAPRCPMSADIVAKGDRRATRYYPK